MEPSILDNIKIVLCNTSHQGNMGSAARAMKTMGLKNLVFVNPVAPPDDHAYALSTHAQDVLSKARIVDSLDEAIADINLAFATTARKRELAQRIYTPRESIAEIYPAILNNQKIAIVFGSEKNGLSSQEVEKCNRLLTIPGNPKYFSLNLAAAVQIVAYEIYCGGEFGNQFEFNPEMNDLATLSDANGVVDHLDKILHQIDYYRNKDPVQTKRNLNHIIKKANLERKEVDLLRGVLKKIENNIVK